MSTGTAGWSSRLVTVFGVRPERLDAVRIDNLIGRVREDEDLDFKRDLFDRNDAGRAELAADVAAMANHRGGVIMIGIDETEAVASAVPGVDLSDEEHLRMTNVIAGITPYVECTILPVAIESENHGCYVIVIPPSPARPHAAVKNDRLGYPRRYGTTKRWLSEAEVADLYRDRFRQADDHSARTSANIRAARAWLRDFAFEDLHVTISVVPTGGSVFTVDQGRLAHFERWSQGFGTRYDGLFAGAHPRVLVGVRQVRLLDGNPPKYGYAMLHTDGAAVVSKVVWHHQFKVANRDGFEGAEFIRTWDLVWPLLQCLKVAARHGADHVAAHGDVLIEAHVDGRKCLGLGDVQFGSLLVPNGEPAELPLVSCHTVAGDALYAADLQGLLAVVRLLLTDIVHGMSVAEVVQIQPDGALENPDTDVRNWAAAVGITVV